MNPPAPLIVHVVNRFAVGGLENGVVNLVNRLPRDAWRHAIVSLTDVDARFAQRVTRDDVEIIAMNKPPGHAWHLYPALYRMFRAKAPAIVHTRNIAALDALPPAWAAGVPVRVHGEHGRDSADPHGRNRRRQRVRRLYRPFVSHYIAVSPDLERYLVERIGVSPAQVTHVMNGVDTARFRPAAQRAPIAGCPFGGADEWLVGSIGRLDPVKDPVNLAVAFVQAAGRDEAARRRMRLVVVGDGHLRGDLETILQQAGLRAHAWLAGERDDIPDILRGLDCFVLPSLAEGVSNTVLEAMATGLPIVATRVGANAELLADGAAGVLVAPRDSDALAGALGAMFADRPRAAAMGAAARGRVEHAYSLERMVDRYHRLYAGMLSSRASDTLRSAELPRG